MAWTQRDKIGASFVGCLLLVCVGGLVGGYYALESLWDEIAGLSDSIDEYEELTEEEVADWLSPTGGGAADLQEMWLRLDAIRAYDLRTTRVFVFAPLAPELSDTVPDQVTHAGGSAPLERSRWPTIASEDTQRAGVLDASDRRMIHSLTLDLRLDGEGIISLFATSATFSPPAFADRTTDLAIVRYDEPSAAVGPPPRALPLEHRPLALDVADIPLAVFALTEIDRTGGDLDAFVRSDPFDGFAPDMSMALHELRRKVVDEGRTELTRLLLEIGDSLYAVPGYVYGEPLMRRSDAPFFFRARAPFTGSPHVHAVDVYDGEIWLDQ